MNYTYQETSSLTTTPKIKTPKGHLLQGEVARVEGVPIEKDLDADSFTDVHIRVPEQPSLGVATRQVHVDEAFDPSRHRVKGQEKFIEAHVNDLGADDNVGVEVGNGRKQDLDADGPAGDHGGGVPLHHKDRLP